MSQSITSLLSGAAQLVDLKIEGLDHPLKMQLHDAGDTIISEKLRSDACWEPYESHLVLKHFQRGQIFVDVGANIGYYTLLASKLTGPEGMVFAYEPDRNNFALLQKNVNHNNLDNVRLYPLALSDRNEAGELFLSMDNFGDHRIYSGGESRISQAIQLVHGSQHLSPKTRHIDFLKVDTQGAEYFVVNGLKELIARNSAHLRMILEFCPYGIRHSGADGHQLIALLDSFGMQYHIIDHIEHKLIPAQSHHLSDWVNDLAQQPDNQGFINLFVSPMGYAVS